MSSTRTCSVAGQANTNVEPIDEHTEIAPGVWWLGGGSLFIASKIVDLDTLARTTIGPAPDGIVFATPHRGLILYAKPRGPNFLITVQTLLGVVDTMARDPDAVLPGGLMSPTIYYLKDGIADVVGGRTASHDELHINASGRFGDLIERLASAPPST